MYPTLFKFGEAGLHTWGLMVMLAFVVAVVRVQRRVPRVGVNPDLLVPMYVLIIIVALFGARLFHFLFATPALFFADPLSFFSLAQGGFVFYGGVVGGAAAGVAFARWRGMPVWKVADICATAIPLGLAVGRIGCFFAGCCHGAPVEAAVEGVLVTMKGGQIVTLDGAPWLGLIYFPGVGVGDTHNVPLVPSQPMAVVGAVVLAELLSLVWRRWRRFDGQVTAMMLVLYAGLRTLLESYRGDSIRGLYELGPVTLSTSQLVSLGMVGVAMVIVAVRWRRGLAPEQPWSAPTEEELDLALLAEEDGHA